MRDVRCLKPGADHNGIAASLSRSHYVHFQNTAPLSGMFSPTDSTVIPDYFEKSCGPHHKGNVMESIQTIGRQSYTMQYLYYASERLAEENYPAAIGGTAIFDYYNTGQVSVVQTPRALPIVPPLTVTYTPSGAPQTMQQLNGVLNTYSYNARLQLQEATYADNQHTSNGCGTSTLYQNPAIQKWDLDLQVFWGQKSDQVTGNNGTLRSQQINTCNGANLATAANFTQSYA